MKEWSPGGTYPRPVTPNHHNQMRSFRSPWNEQNIDKTSAKPLVVNIRAISDTRSRTTFQQRSQEEISKTSLACNKIKKNVTGSSDPRFKRVITGGAQNDACVGTDQRQSRPSSPVKLKEEPQKTEALVLVNEESKAVVAIDSKHQCQSISQVDKDSMKSQFTIEGVLQHGQGTAPPTPDPSPSLRDNSEKYSLPRDIASNVFPKQSVSDCTINTRNTSLVSEDVGEEYAERLHTFSSTTRVKKVQNWIADQKPKLDKRQSVITVIGQTQGYNPLSLALHEIDQRRKLVKELDKYAICNKITDSDKDKEMNTLVAQINFLSPTGKLLYSGDKKYDVKEFPSKLKGGGVGKYQESGDKLSKRMSANYDDVRYDNEVNTDQETSLAPSSQASSNQNEKSQAHCYKLKDKYDIKGKIRRIFTRIPYSWLAYFMILISGTLCWYTYLTFQKNGYFFFEIFPQKPKTVTWYEKLCYWIWEIFRPSGNYQRSSTSAWISR